MMVDIVLFTVVCSELFHSLLSKLFFHRTHGAYFLSPLIFSLDRQIMLSLFRTSFIFVFVLFCLFVYFSGLWGWVSWLFDWLVGWLVGQLVYLLLSF